MLLSRIILVLLIYIQFIVTLFSHHAYSSPKKHESTTLYSTQISNQLSYNELILNKDILQSKQCIFSGNLEEIANVLDGKEFNNIDPIVSMALNHPEECEAEHLLDSIASIIRHLYKCGRNDAIQKIVGQLTRKKS